MSPSSYFIRFYKLGTWLGLALLPSIGLVGLSFVANPAQKFILFTFHEIAISLACLFSALVGWLAYHGYQKNGISTLRYWAFAFLGFAIIYSLHGLMTCTAMGNPIIFLIFGPTSRIILAVYLLWGLLRINRAPDPESRRFQPSQWRTHIGCFLIINVGLLLLLASPIQLAPLHIRSLETISLAILTLAFLRMLLLLPIRSPLMQAHFLAVIFFIQASLSFLSSAPWNAVWWYAHACSGIGFFILGYGIVRAYETTETFDSIYDVQELRRKLIRTEEEKTELALLIQQKEKAENRLKNALNELQQMQVQLENRVEERTAELKQAKEEAECAKKAADAASQAKSEFLANMSHELRTPLNGILGYTQILKRDKNATSKQRDGVSIIHQCASHLLTLINDILDLSKIEARKMEISPNNFHFPNFITGVAEICRIRAEQKEIDFTYEALNQLPTAIQADEKRLRQVLINLLSNAIKFTERGKVTLKVGVLESATQFPATNRKIRFQVEDTGIGISPDQIEKIFLPFEQVGDTSRKLEGTGLGLAITQQLAKLMGSEIKVESHPGQGSRFWLDIELPEALEWKESAKTNKSESIIGYEGNRKKVLVVDDRWENRSIILGLLEPIGFEIREATNGQEGLEQVADFHPDLIIVDLVMPVMDGFEMTRRLRKMPEGDKLPVIASSASVFNFDRQKSQEYGCNEFLPKPIQVEELLEYLQNYLGLKWINESQNVGVINADETNSQTSEILAPSPDELAKLHYLARIGDIKGVEGEAIRLKQMNHQYTGFANQLLELTEEFEEKAILIFVEQYIEGN